MTSCSEVFLIWSHAALTVTAVVSSLQCVYLWPSLQMVSCIVPTCILLNSAKYKHVRKVVTNQDYAADGTLLGGNPNAITKNTEALLRCRSSVYFTNSHFVLGPLVLGYLCNPLWSTLEYSPLWATLALNQPVTAVGSHIKLLWRVFPLQVFVPGFVNKSLSYLCILVVKLILHIAGVNYYCMYSYNTKWVLKPNSKKRKGV